MTDNFTKAVEIIFSLEGGYSNDPNDPGGETNFGISKRAYPGIDIKTLDKATAAAIYLTDYWTPAKCDAYAWPLCLFVFDAAVNQGLDAANRCLQKAAGVAVDGIVGTQTQRAVASQNPYNLSAMFLAERALRYTGTRNFDKYGRGWFKRLFEAAIEV
jgi:lysozyme family protein